MTTSTLRVREGVGEGARASPLPSSTCSPGGVQAQPPCLPPSPQSDISAMKGFFFVTYENEKYLGVHQPLKTQLPQMGSIKNK